MPPRSNNPRSERVTIICSNNGSNCLGRSLLLADLLREQWDVSVVGVQTTLRAWEPASSFATPVRSFPLRSSSQLPAAARWLRAELRGARVVVCKPKPTSLGLALAVGVRPRDALLDVDDWDLGFGDAPRSRAELCRRAPYYLKTLLHPARFNSYLGVRAAFALVPLFPRRIVSNAWLQREVGGELLPHVRDSAVFDPARVDRGERRDALGLTGRPWVGFIGTIRPHKGIEDLIAALTMLTGTSAPGLLLAGVGAEPAAEERALIAAAQARLGDDRLRVAPKFPFRELPGYLAAPDVLCIPSRPGTTSAGQIPAKLFDALMMGKPLVVSDAHDIPEVEADAAVRFRAGDVSDLAEKLGALCASASEREALGTRARTLAVRRFDYTSARSVLVPLIERLRPLPA